MATPLLPRTFKIHSTHVLRLGIRTLPKPYVRRVSQTPGSMSKYYKDLLHYYQFTPAGSSSKWDEDPFYDRSRVHTDSEVLEKTEGKGKQVDPEVFVKRGRTRQVSEVNSKQFERRRPGPARGPNAKKREEDLPTFSKLCLSPFTPVEYQSCTTDLKKPRPAFLRFMQDSFENIMSKPEEKKEFRQQAVGSGLNVMAKLWRELAVFEKQVRLQFL